MNSGTAIRGCLRVASADRPTFRSRRTVTGRHDSTAGLDIFVANWWTRTSSFLGGPPPGHFNVISATSDGDFEEVSKPRHPRGQLGCETVGRALSYDESGVAYRGRPVTRGQEGKRVADPTAPPTVLSSSLQRRPAADLFLPPRRPPRALPEPVTRGQSVSAVAQQMVSQSEQLDGFAIGTNDAEGSFDCLPPTSGITSDLATQPSPGPTASTTSSSRGVVA